ncbi:hypothetical protein F2Q69_00038280 [Brassica cretica]|uniref:Uncharacterized protein n=1 Tax=Brassica cretica TaxID=69181 RepID=A0A8S9SEG9_BRACR|nr:hypothetical protein F2Q69_00038280 [Brassica cretica]
MSMFTACTRLKFGLSPQLVNIKSSSYVLSEQRQYLKSSGVAGALPVPEKEKEEEKRVRGGESRELETERWRRSNLTAVLTIGIEDWRRKGGDQTERWRSEEGIE